MMMSIEKYIPTEFYKTIYQSAKDPEKYKKVVEYSFDTAKGRRKHTKNSIYNYTTYTVYKEEVVENTAQSNFKICEMHYTNLDYYSIVDGVYVTDPRGESFKISNANFIQLARECTIRNGTIEDECVVGFNKDGKITLVRVGSSYYNEVMDYTKKQNENIDEKDLKVGSVYIMKQDAYKKYVYLGKHKIKTKPEVWEFLCGISQPKHPQHVFCMLYTDNSIDNRAESFKPTSISHECKNSKFTMDMKRIIKDFKNSKQGRVLTKIEITKMTEDNKTYYRNSKIDVYTVFKKIDGTYHLGLKHSYKSEISYICPLDENLMPVLTPELKKNSYCYFHSGRAGFHDTDVEFYNCKFYFEDDLSIDIT